MIGGHLGAVVRRGGRDEAGRPRAHDAGGRRAGRRVRGTGTGRARDSHDWTSCRPGKPSGRTGRGGAATETRAPTSRLPSRVTSGSSTNTSITCWSRRAATSSRLHAATPDRAGGIGLNQARRIAPILTVRAGSACGFRSSRPGSRRGSEVHSKAPQSALRRTHRLPTAAARSPAAEPAPSVPARLGEPPNARRAVVGCGV